MNAITVQDLGKKFKLFSSQGGRFLEYLSLGAVTRHADFWALQDISFDVEAGTTLGILGQNGSGKSTLLSILAGILEPSAGAFTINGKVSAILELGSGFHPEFSGRDNVYMYGSIVGLSKEQIDVRFDEIIRFSELGDFIDQPLRTYSSGMVVRLAFSVAVNVNADILIVDEALAVGDAIFQHRCFRKIREMQEAGKTILYVGHDTEVVRNLCTSALLLDGGRIIARGDPNTVVNKYHTLIAERERAYSEGNLIEHGEVPETEYETVYDFIRNLKDATAVGPPAIPVQEMTIEVSSTPRKILFAHTPSKVSYSLTIEPGSFLVFAIGILSGAWDKIPRGVIFEIDILCDGENVRVFSHELQPGRNNGDRGWHNFIVSLERFGTKPVVITFSTTGSGGDSTYGWSAWGWGKLGKTLQKPRIETTATLHDRQETVTPVTTPEMLPIRPAHKNIEIINVVICDSAGMQKPVFLSNEQCQIKITIACREFTDHDVTVGFTLLNKYSIVYATNTRWLNNDLKNLKPGDRVEVVFSFCLRLAVGFYSMTPAVALVHSDSDIEMLDQIENRFFIKISSDKNAGGFADLDAMVRWQKEGQQ